ncbi:MAG: hypothetical protein ABIO40_00050 [Devosia sp.]
MQHQLQSRPPSARPIAIEVEGEPLGVVVPAEAGYRFLAVRLAAFGIDGQYFDSVEAARAAVADAAQQAQKQTPAR